MDAEHFIWVFVGDDANLPSAVFSSVAKAEKWIEGHKLSGILTAYPVDIGIYEWAITKGYYKACGERTSTPKFIGRFSSAHLPHFHYENGVQAESDAGE